MRLLAFVSLVFLAAVLVIVAASPPSMELWQRARDDLRRNP